MREQLKGQIVTPDGVIAGTVDITDGVITAITPSKTRAKGWIVPGFVDIHNHGGGGHTFTTGDADAARAAAAFHREHGTTTLLASLVSSPFELMCQATSAYRELCEEGVLGGIHFEGPYLAELRCGAQNPAYLRDASTEEVSELVKLGGGHVRMMTIAPERPGALDAIRLLTSNGVVAAVGHTDATYAETKAAVDAGATVATHLFNGMRPVHHREPGPIIGLLDDARISCELIADGIHLHDAALAFAARTAGADRAILVTDAMAAAGMPDGTYELGGLEVAVADRVARLTRDGSIAGSTLTMDAALRQAVGAGLSIVDAARMAATTPARAIGIGHLTGSITVGHRADLVLLDEDLHVTRVISTPWAHHG